MVNRLLLLRHHVLLHLLDFIYYCTSVSQNVAQTLIAVEPLSATSEAHRGHCNGLRVVAGFAPQIVAASF